MGRRQRVVDACCLLQGPRQFAAVADEVTKLFETMRTQKIAPQRGPHGADVEERRRAASTD
jgi:hypothetical protein